MRRTAIAIVVVLGFSFGGGAQSADINAFISTAVKAATDQILAPFERANGHTIFARYAPSGAPPGLRAAPQGRRGDRGDARPAARLLEPD